MKVQQVCQQLWRGYDSANEQQYTMRSGSTTTVLAKCRLKYCRISECSAGWAPVKVLTGLDRDANGYGSPCLPGSIRLRALEFTTGSLHKVALFALAGQAEHALIGWGQVHSTRILV